MNALAGYIHFVITLFGAYLVFWPMHYEGLAGMPRRYLDYSGWSLFDQFQNLNIFITNGVIIILAAQALFLFNFCYSIFKGKRINTSVL